LTALLPTRIALTLSLALAVLALLLTLTLSLSLALSLLSLLSLLLALALLASLSLLARLTALTLPLALTAALLLAGRPRQLLPQALYLIERTLHPALLSLAGLAAANRGLCFPRLLRQTIQPLRDRLLAGRQIRSEPSPEPFGMGLHAHLQLVLLHGAERLTKLAGCRSLATRHTAGCILHIALEPVEIVRHLLFLAGKTLRLLAVVSLPGLLLSVAERLPQPVRKVALLSRQLFRTPRDRVQFLTGLLLAHRAQRIFGFVQPVCRPSGVRCSALRFVRLRARGPAHIVRGATQPFECLADLPVLTASASRGRGRLAALLSLLPALLSLLSLLSLLLALLPLR
jgi:hypothetical protein